MMNWNTIANLTATVAANAAISRYCDGSGCNPSLAPVSGRTANPKRRVWPLLKFSPVGITAGVGTVAPEPLSAGGYVGRGLDFGTAMSTTCRHIRNNANTSQRRRQALIGRRDSKPPFIAGLVGIASRTQSKVTLGGAAGGAKPAFFYPVRRSGVDGAAFIASTLKAIPPRIDLALIAAQKPTVMACVKFNPALSAILNYHPAIMPINKPQSTGKSTTGRAAKDLGRKCVMIEREEKYCAIAADRMRQEVLAL